MRSSPAFPQRFFCRCQRNDIVDVSALSACALLTSLEAAGNHLRTVPVLPSFLLLTHLDLSRNRLASPLDLSTTVSGRGTGRGA